MTKKEQITTVLERIGYKPMCDEDGDILIRYQLKHFYFFVNEEDEDHFIQIIHPQFAEIEEGEETIHLAACNKVTRETKMAKVFVDQTFKNITASCEFFYTDEDALEMNIAKALRILGVIRTSYRNVVRELSE